MTGTTLCLAGYDCPYCIFGRSGTDYFSIFKYDLLHALLKIVLNLHENSFYKRNMKRSRLLLSVVFLAGNLLLAHAGTDMKNRQYGQQEVRTTAPAAGVNLATYPDKTVSTIRQFYRILENYRNYRDAMTERWDDIYIYSAPDRIRSDADFYKLAMPATYYSAPIEQAMSIEGWEPVIPFIKKENPLKDSLFQVPRLTHTADVDRAINKQLLSFYLQYPNLVKKNETNFEDIEPLDDRMIVTRPKKEKVMNLLTPERVQQVSEKDLMVLKPNFWTVGGSGYIQGSQNYISDNWYKGGESTVALISGLTWQFNYDDKQRMQFENKIEWKLGFVTAPSDTVHQYKTNDDLFRISSKLGYRAIANWYYTLSGEFKTQFFSKYDTNSDNLVSSLLSPAELNLGLGMDYKYVKDGVCNLSVLLNPLNYTFYSVMSDRVDPTKFNVKAGHKTRSQLGSRVEATVKWSIYSNLMWESRFSYTTNYEQVLSEWENTFTFAFNKYFSTKLFVHARFDDSVTREEGDSYFQLQELLSLGFNYAW